MEDDQLVKNKLEEDLLYWIPRVRGEACSADNYLIMQVLPYAVDYSPLDDDVIRQAKELVKNNKVFEEADMIKEYGHYFKKLGIF